MKKRTCLILFCLLLVSSASAQPLRPSLEVLNRELLEAASDGTVDEVERLLLMGASINTKNEYGSTPFKLAITNNNCPVVELFLKRGQDPNRDSDNPLPGGTPLMSAAANRNVELLELLLKYGADPNYPTAGKHTALMSATGDTRIFMTLVDHKANVHARDNYDRTILHWAALHGTEDVVKFLCQKGLDPEAKDMGGNTPISNAEGKGRGEIVRLLKECRK